MRALAAGLVTLCLAVGCVQAPTKDAEAETPELGPELKSLVLDQAPTDIPHPLFIDFNGRAELVGYALEPETVAAPGSKLTLKLYWHSTAPLEEGYVPYTELVLPDGKRSEVEGAGPLRKGPLTPSNWEPGKVYVDELEIAVPADIEAPRFSIIVGLRTPPSPAEPAEVEPKAAETETEKTPAKAVEGTFGAVYLAVISGPADSKHGGVIATLETGATPGAQRVRATKKGNRRPPGVLKRLPSKPVSGRPVSGKPARPRPRAE